MGALAQDEAARRERLEHWASEQSRLAEPPKKYRIPWQLRPRWFAQRVLNLRRLLQICARVAERVSDWGLHTAGDVVAPEHAHPDWVRYAPSPWRLLPRALDYLGVSDADTFVDFGCGKGRVLHQAARRPFRRVIGVEISPELAEIARVGLARRSYLRRCGSVEIVVADAAQFDVPDDLTIGYFCHPFEGETLAGVLRNIIASIDRHPRRVRLIYVYPIRIAEFLATRRFRLVAEQREQRNSGLYGAGAVILESC
jgi:SAM-dependent methyltransferase